GAGADPGKEAIQTEIEQADRKPLHRGEEAVERDAEHQRPHPADIVSQNAEDEPAGGPAEQTGHDRRPPHFPIWAICSGGSTPVAEHPSKLGSAGCSTSENSPKPAASSVQPSHTTTNTNHW